MQRHLLKETALMYHTALAAESAANDCKQLQDIHKPPLTVHQVDRKVKKQSQTHQDRQRLSVIGAVENTMPHNVVLETMNIITVRRDTWHRSVITRRLKLR